jgi:hypothetical protein
MADTWPSQAPRPLRYPMVALPLTQFSVTFFSTKEAHRFFIADVLWAIYDGNHIALGTYGLAGTNVLCNFFKVALLWIPITPDLNPNLVVRHRASFLPPADSDCPQLSTVLLDIALFDLKAACALILSNV